MRNLVLAGVLAAVGCHKASSPPASATGPISTTAQDALWALAPEGAQVGVVGSPRAVAMIEHAWTDIRAAMSATPDLAPFGAQVDAMLAALTGGKLARLADLGLTADQGFALFVLDRGEGIAILPVVDRDKFLAIAHGTKAAKPDEPDRVDGGVCKMIKPGYACATTEAVFARLGKGAMLDKLGLVKARGDLEVVATTVPWSPRGSFAGVAQLERGAVVVRVAIGGVSPPHEMAAALGSPAKARADVDHDAGFAMVNLGPFLATAPPIPLTAGVTLTALVKTIAGPLTVTMPAGALGVDARVPLDDPAPAKTLVEHCGDIAPLAAIGARVDSGKCRFTVPQMNLELEAWVEGKELRIGTAGVGKGASIAMTPIGAELAQGEWSFAFWGRGTMFGSSPANLAALTPQGGVLPPEASAMIHAIGMIDELGFAARLDPDALRLVGSLRTSWSNPDDVVTKLLAILPADLLAGRAGDPAKRIADAAPDSAFAPDFKSGYAGLMIPAAMVGMVAAVAIPAFMDYMKKSKQTEASLQLTKIGKHAKRYFDETAAFPVGNTKLGPTCCDGPQHKCAVDPAQYSDPVWADLDFGIDEPHLYQYRYESDGKTFTAEAVGDLDCDSTMITYALHGAIENGRVTTTLVEPPPNSD